MKILLTGITGFVGGHLSKRLVKDGYDLCALIRNPDLAEEYRRQDIRCFCSANSLVVLWEFLKKEQFDGVIHCASCFLGEHKPEDIRDLVMSNILLSTQLLELSVKTRVRWFINTGTFWQHYRDKKYSPVNLYAATKEAFESLARYYVESSDINFVTLKLSDTYGPNDTRPKIFSFWKESLESGRTLEMSKGEQYLDVVYIEDVVDAYIRVVDLLQRDDQRRLAGRSFAVSSGRPLKLRALADVFERVSGRRLNIVWGKREYREREVMKPWSKGVRIPGWRAKVSLDEGIEALLRATAQEEKACGQRASS